MSGADERVEGCEPGRRWTRRQLLVGGAGVLLAGTSVDALWWEPSRPEVTAHTVVLPGLPPDLAGLKIAQLSDLHCGPNAGEEDIARVVHRCNRLVPDLVVLTGDFISRSAGYAAPCARALSRLKAPRGLYAVRGNHDNWHGPTRVMAHLRAAGVAELLNRGTRVAPGLHLAGIDDLWTGEADLERALRGWRPRGEGLVLLSHSPNVLPIAAEAGLAGLCLAGHTHGGQVRLPLIPRQWLPGLRSSRYVSGWYAEGPSRMYVNRGIGTVFIRARLFCRPEISLYTLQAARPQPRRS